MEQLNAYPLGTICKRPLRNQTPESWKLKAAIAKRVWDHYKIPCWVSNNLAKIKRDGRTYLKGSLKLSQDANDKTFLLCDWANSYCPEDRAITLELKDYPDLSLIIVPLFD